MTRPQAAVFRNAIIIGGTSGLGAAVAEVFASVTGIVHLTSRDGSTDLDAAVAAVAAAGGEAKRHALTLPDEDDRGTAVRRLLAAATPCDVVVNCAVVNEPATATIANASRFRATLDANVFGAYQVASVAAQAMAATGGGCVVNVSSILTRRYIVGALGYVTSKVAIEALTRGFAKEWRELGVRFVTVAPGPIRDTRLLASVPRAAAEAVLGKDFERHLIDATQVATIIRGLAEPAANAVTGEVVVVDNGASL